MSLKHLVNTRLRRSPILDRLLDRLLGRFSTYPARDFQRFTRSNSGTLTSAGGLAALPPPTEPLRLPEPAALAPGTFELRFAGLHSRGDYVEMWDCLAEDAQRSWGGREHFVERMKKQGAEYELLDARVSGVDIVPEWTDRKGNRTYQNVARLAVRYRIRHGWREVAMDRQVHLVPAAGGWRTLFYPVAE